MSDLACCPECSRDLQPEHLCEHDIQDTGPLCRDCCDRLHSHDGRAEACNAHQESAHGHAHHYCVGDQGHVGRHWCLLGHVWTDAHEEAS